MSVAGGIGLRDLGHVGSLNGTGWKWTMLNADHYKVDYPVYQPDMYVGEANFLKLLREHSNIDLFLNSPLLDDAKSVIKSGTAIQAIVTANSTDMIRWNAAIFIDASYEGDLARFAGASYTYGRESHAQFNEELAGVRPRDWTGNFLEKYPSSALKNGTSELVPYVIKGPMATVGTADDKMMGYSYRLCITNKVSNQAPFPKPEGYNPDDFILLQRYIDTLVESKKFVDGPPLHFMVDVLDYRSYPYHDKWDMCDSTGSAFTSDVINLNRGYVTASQTEREKIAKDHYYYIAGMLTYLSTDPRVPAYTRRNTLSWGLCKDQWPSNGHWPPQLYVREGLRIVGDVVFTQHDLIGGKCKSDSIAVGSWPIDVHVVQRIAVEGSDGRGTIADNEGQIVSGIYGSGGVYDIPYSIMLPKRSQTSNLLVPVCHSATHIAYGSLRVEPTFIQLGQAAGTAAYVALRDKIKHVADVDVSHIQEQLIKDDMYVHWPPKTSC
eukprot:TRINITY_DN7121_c0_g1_i1.p1 TRINITY_DN7121_c0_g1~~TRINITY_DN7121_c0_g1_i1.p1  ORF type:complete len:556 (-),score=123.72 TRINITY_DN7121_c0_g1_i1:147-1625(-)